MAVSLDLNRIFFEYPFLVPDYFALITRAMIVLEGIAVTGDPEFDLFSAAYPYTARSDYCHFRRNTHLTTELTFYDLNRRAVSLFGLSSLTQIAREVYLAEQRLKKEEEEESKAFETSQQSTWKRFIFW